MAQAASFQTPMELERIARQVRATVIELSHKGQSPHLGSSLSCVDILVACHFAVLNIDPGHLDDPHRDRFILSKGHAAIALYATLAHRGYFDRAMLIRDYNKDGGSIPEQPAPHCLPGVELATGSLGHGMGLAVGMAYADRSLRADCDIYVVLSDGELQEGSTWENMMMAANLGVDRVVAFLDHNGSQSFGHTRETHPKFYPIREKIEAFGWESAEVDGHDPAAIGRAVTARRGGRPFMLIANTVKGRGVSFMEHQPIWHYRSPTAAEYAQAIADLTKDGR